MHFMTICEFALGTPDQHPASHRRNLGAALNGLVTDAEFARRSARLRADARGEGRTPRATDLIENMLA